MTQVISKKRTKIKLLLILQQKKQHYNTTQHFEAISHPLLYSTRQGCFVGYTVQAEAVSDPNDTIRNKKSLMHVIHN